jgi:Holliday junction DNA helicase RuvA
VIGFLQGRPLLGEGDEVILLTQGVGYELHCSQNTRDEIEGREFVEVWVHTHVREDALMLFGFSTQLEKQVFLSLLKVSGIGPKSATNILSAARLEDLVRYIEEGDVKALSKLPKVGKKTAEQMILTLQGKLVRVDQPVAQKQKNAARDQIVTALINLGFRLQEVEKVVDQLDPQLDVQEGLRRSLSALTT